MDNSTKLEIIISNLQNLIDKKNQDIEKMKSTIAKNTEKLHILMEEVDNWTEDQETLKNQIKE